MLVLNYIKEDIFDIFDIFDLSFFSTKNQ